MRPRHKAAENGEAAEHPAEPGRASMRPRHKAAENELDIALHQLLHGASMRPRHKAAENAVHQVRDRTRLLCFNEAAA